MKNGNITCRGGKRGGKSLEATTKMNQDSSYVPPIIVCDTCGSQRLKREDGKVVCRECGAEMNQRKETIKPPTTKKVGQSRLF